MKGAGMKKIPLRTCIGCNLIRPKRELVRVIINEKKQVEIDPTGKSKGRGSYLCRIATEIEKVQSGKLAGKNDKTFTIDASCLEKAKAENAFSRAFKKKISSSNI